MNWLEFGGITAIVAIIGAAWGHIKTTWSYIVSFVIISIEVDTYMTWQTIGYCMIHGKMSRMGPRAYIGRNVYVRPLQRTAFVAGESLPASRLIWFGWKPVWISKAKDTDEWGIRVSFIHGTFTQDGFIKSVVDCANSIKNEGIESRYSVYHITGTAGTTVIEQRGSGKRGGSLDSHDNHEPDHQTKIKSSRIIGWASEDIGVFQSPGRAMDQLAICPETQAVVDTVKSWYESKDWFFERSLPWKLGIGLHGKPGTGKTILIRSLAQDLGMPIHVFDLATLKNSELREGWANMESNSPAIALFEDLDSVFHGRESIANDQITFDCLLNCIDGVQASSGILTVVTTNKPELLDPALFTVNEKTKIAENRPGRIDIVASFGPLGEQERAYLAARILPEYPEQQKYLVASCDGYSGAQFYRKCVDQALQLYWEAKNPGSALNSMLMKLGVKPRSEAIIEDIGHCLVCGRNCVPEGGKCKRCNAIRIF